MQESGDTQSLTTSDRSRISEELIAPQISLCRPHPQTPAQCGSFQSHLLLICAAKPRDTAATAHEHRKHASLDGHLILGWLAGKVGPLPHYRDAAHDRVESAASRAPALVWLFLQEQIKVIIIKCMWPLPRFPYTLPSPDRWPTTFAIARSCAWCSSALLTSPCELYGMPRFPYACPPPGRPPPLQSPGAACGTRWPSHSPPANHTRCRGLRTRCPPHASPARSPTSLAMVLWSGASCGAERHGKVPQILIRVT